MAPSCERLPLAARGSPTTMSSPYFGAGAFDIEPMLQPSTTTDAHDKTNRRFLRCMRAPPSPLTLGQAPSEPPEHGMCILNDLSGRLHPPSSPGLSWGGAA